MLLEMQTIALCAHQAGNAPHKRVILIRRAVQAIIVLVVKQLARNVLQISIVQTQIAMMCSPVLLEHSVQLVQLNARHVPRDMLAQL